jgi:aminoglycoside/choline kinase family phosphotransferase
MRRNGLMMSLVNPAPPPPPGATDLRGADATAPLERIADLARVLDDSAPVTLEKMPGGASTRQFFRVQVGAHRAVAMYVPDAGRPEEVSNVPENERRWPFLEIRELLEQGGVRVPRLVAEECTQGLLLVEDLGDDTVAAYLAEQPERCDAIYRLAVRDLAKAQDALATLSTNSIVRERAFDASLLAWEIDHFREWGLEARGITLTVGESTLFDEARDRIASEIASWPRGFVHRDYQSRNLMVMGRPSAEELAWIDFQDALMGPRAYDLVALLQDSYQSFDDAFIATRLDEYAAHRGLDAEDRASIGREFDLITVQRKLKDAGRFVFIEHKKGDRSYLPFVEPTIAKVRRALKRLSNDPMLHGLDEILARVWR